MSTEHPHREPLSIVNIPDRQCSSEAAHRSHGYWDDSGTPFACTGFVGRAGVPAHAEPARRWVTCQNEPSPHVIDAECVNATDVPWTPGEGMRRIRATMPGMVPDLTDEDYAKADEIIAKAPKRCTSKIAHESGVVLQCLLGVGHPTPQHRSGQLGAALWHDEDDRVLVATQGPSINAELIVQTPSPSTLDLIRRYGSLRVNQEVVPNDVNGAKVKDMVALLEARINTDRAEAYERGIAEGRRQATEGWEREWGYGRDGDVRLCKDEDDARVRRPSGLGSSREPSRRSVGARRAARGE